MAFCQSVLVGEKFLRSKWSGSGSVPEIHSHVAGTLSNQPTTTAPDFSDSRFERLDPPPGPKSHPFVSCRLLLLKKFLKHLSTSALTSCRPAVASARLANLSAHSFPLIPTRGVRFYRFSGFYRFALFTVRKTGSF